MKNKRLFFKEKETKTGGGICSIYKSRLRQGIWAPECRACAGPGVLTVPELSVLNTSYVWSGLYCLKLVE